MVKIIMHPLYDEFMHLCGNADISIKLCAPYIKNSIIDDIINKKRAKTKMSVITNMNIKNFHKNSSDLIAIKRVIQSGGSVFNCTTLHAKFYLFDNAHCIITSANLTSSGFLHNVECGIYSDDSYFVNNAVEKYDQLAMNDNVGKVSEHHIEFIKNILDNLPSQSAIEYPHYDIPLDYQANIDSITERLTGWKKHVFKALNEFQNDEFSSDEVSILANQLGEVFPKNHNREAKIRQVLQQLRDIGLIQFIEPGLYKILWRGKY